MNPKNLEIPFSVVSPTGQMLITEVKENKTYIDGKPSGERNGYRYEVVVLPRYEKLTIKVLGQAEPSITNAQIEAAGGSVRGKPIDFIGRVYVMNGTAGVSATAKAIEILK